ncbi:DRAP deaminase [Cucurbitaria berberidis CBS 394.84]|uniref:Pseudouridine synthase n=1 Tax=Cucurbitaria berberidis CBS 394.84 TaxID=1168544 RepID=A0A9P4GKH1_9PLEO|nr:DRAP deaminase [Cucurbitaria berberidis CBS 394.84]KAF1847006.1 DRAP deaminase [Cucurbitaria berberidis CBS 394.84]
MALVPSPPRDKYPPLPDDKFPWKDPPPVVITPCDPWPPPYYLEDGLRKVTPYHYTYNTFCKQRWRGREILDIFASEFRDRPTEYYEQAIVEGRVVVNGQPVPSTKTIVKNGDVISHTLHRHEPPCTAKSIGIVHEDDDLIVIDKPAGMPVHPAGRYNFNSIIEIMRADRGYGWNPLPCNRLDRLTSGIMFIGKHKRAAEDMSAQIRQRTVKKEYVTRVVGEFPEGEVVCEKPILQISPKLGLNRVRANGKEALTVFKRLAYYPPKDPDRGSQGPDSETDPQGQPWKKLRGYSIVRCFPVTGRTHQLRVHLQFLGHPIANDPIYANQRVFGPSLGRGQFESENDEDIMSRLSRMGKEEVADAVAYHDEMVDAYEKKKAERMTGENCKICDTPLYSDPGAHELGIYLHARRYRCEEGKWDYETGLPDWALPPPGYEGPTESTKESDPLAIDLKKLGLDDEDDEKVGTKPAQGAVNEGPDAAPDAQAAASTVL